MKKENKPFFKKAVLIVMFVILLNLGTFAMLYKNDFAGGISGMAIKQSVKNAYDETSPISKIFLLSQWALLILFLITSFVRDRVLLKSNEKINGIELTKAQKGTQTDLDTLYETLKMKKELGISNIAKTFKVNKEIAMGWAKTLESSKLAIIDYPGIGSPVLKLAEK